MGARAPPPDRGGAALTRGQILQSSIARRARRGQPRERVQPAQAAPLSERRQRAGERGQRAAERPLDTRAEAHAAARRALGRDRVLVAQGVQRRARVPAQPAARLGAVDDHVDRPRREPRPHGDPGACLRRAVRRPHRGDVRRPHRPGRDVAQQRVHDVGRGLDAALGDDHLVVGTARGRGRLTAPARGPRSRARLAVPDPPYG